MGIVTQFLSDEHTHCDSLFAELESLANRGAWDKVCDEFDRFINAMESHFTGEEEVLFPAFEQRTGHSVGPTRIMRMEHSQMRQLFTNMRIGIERRDRDFFLSQSETLLMLMRQHNAKEEQMLYPMCDQVLGQDADSIVSKIQQRRE